MGLNLVAGSAGAYVDRREEQLARAGMLHLESKREKKKGKTHEK